MASDKTISIRLTIDQADKLREEIKQLGTNGEAALDKIDNARKKASAGMLALNDVTGAARSKFENLSGSLGTAGTAMSRFGTAGLAAAAALAGVIALQRSAISAFMESEQSVRRLDAALAATGNTTGYTRNQLEIMANSLSQALKIDDDDIRQAMATLATFGTVGRENFGRVIQLSADLSATWGGDLSSNAAKLAEIMDRLGSGSADGLRKAFVELSQEQIALITNLAEGGKSVEAQEALLRALQERIGGQAEADANTVTGSVRGLNNAWDDLLKSLAATDTYKRFIDGLTDRINGLAEAISGARAAQGLQTGGTPLQFDSVTNNGVLAEGISGTGTGALDSSIFKSQDEIASRSRMIQLYMETEERAAAQAQRLAQMSAESRAVEQKVEEARKRAREQGITLTDAEVASIRALAKETVSLEVAQKSNTAASQKQRDAHSDLLKEIENQSDASERMLKAYGLGAAAVQSMTIELEAEQKVREAGVDLNSAEGKALEARVRGMLELEQSVKDVSDAQKEGQKQAEAYAKQQEELALEPIKNAIASVQDEFSGMFENVLTNGVSSFKDLGGNIKSIFIKLASEIATLMVFNPQVIMSGSSIGNMIGTGGSLGGSSGSSVGSSGGVSSLFSSAGNLLSGGTSSTLTSGLNSLGSLFGIGTDSALVEAGLTKGLSGYSSLTNGSFGGTLGGSLGGIGGSMLAKGIFGSSGVGADIGGTVGAIAGSFIPVPILGPMIGSFIGTAIGGLFGNKKPTNAWANSEINFDTGASKYWNSGKGNAAENQKIMESAYGQVLQFAQGFNDLGVGTITGKITAEQGVRDPGYAYVNGVKVTAEAGQFGQLAINALKEALKQTNISNSDVSTALKKVDFTDLSSALSDVQFAANFRDSLKAYTDGLTDEASIKQQAAAAADAVAQSMIAFRDATERLGLDLPAATDAVEASLQRLHDGTSGTTLSEVEQAIISVKAQMEGMTPALLDLGYSAAQATQWVQEATDNNLAALRDKFGANVEDQILALTNPQELALKQLDAEFAQIRADATTLGYDMAKIEELYGLKRKQVVEQINSSIVSSTVQAGQRIQAWLDSQMLGNLSSLSPTAKLVEAQGQFDSVITAARGGDSTALGTVTNTADALLNAARSVYASSADYTLIEQMVRSTLSNLGTTLGLPGFAVGTDSAPPGLAWVGENGRELMQMRGGERVYTASQSASIAKGWDTAPVVDGLREVGRVSAQGTLALAKELRQLQSEVADLTQAVRRVVAK